MNGSQPPTPSAAGGIRKASGLKQPGVGGIVAECVPPPEIWYGVKSSKRTVAKIDLHENNLTGPLPGSPGTGVFPPTSAVPPEGTMSTILGKLKVLVLFKNKLHGQIPPTYDKFIALQHLDLSHNLLEGDLPPSLFTIKTLKRLHIECNFTLSGTIPDTVGELTNLEAFTAHYNRIGGTLPSTIKKCGKLAELSLHHNRLEGIIPPALAEISTLKTLHLSNNHFYLPSEETVLDLHAMCGFPTSPRTKGTTRCQVLPQTQVGDDSDDDFDGDGESEAITLDGMSLVSSGV